LADITISDMLRRTIEQFGDEGSAWLDALPGTIARLEADWDVRVGHPFELAGVSYAAEATRGSGKRVVLKVPIPHDEAEHEADALRVWNGVGAVELLELDEDTGSMLLEACEPGVRLSEAAAPDEVSTIGGEMLRTLHRDPPAGHPFTSLSDAMTRWAGLTRERVRTIGDRAKIVLVDEGAELLESLPAASDRQVLLHGDYHHWNVLSAVREPWLVIDPKPMVGDPTYDSAQFLGNRYGTRGPDEFEGELRRFAAGAGFDELHVLRWCFARECENSQWHLSVKDPDGARGSITYAHFLRNLIDERGGLR
jgi:streptomycin 6-kinase